MVTGRMVVTPTTIAEEGTPTATITEDTTMPHMAVLLRETTSLPKAGLRITQLAEAASLPTTRSIAAIPAIQRRYGPEVSAVADQVLPVAVAAVLVGARPEAEAVLEAAQLEAAEAVLAAAQLEAAAVLEAAQLEAAEAVLVEVRLVAVEAPVEAPVPPAATTKNGAIFAEARCHKTCSSQFRPVSAGLQNQCPPSIRRKVS